MKELLIEILKSFRGLGDKYLFPIIMTGMVLALVYCILDPMVRETNQTFKEYVVETHEMRVTLDRIADIFEKRCE